MKKERKWYVFLVIGEGIRAFIMELSDCEFEVISRLYKEQNGENSWSESYCGSFHIIEESFDSKEAASKCAREYVYVSP